MFLNKIKPYNNISFQFTSFSNDIFIFISIRNVIDVGDTYVMMAGLVDTSVHIQDPGRGDWEGFAAATKAAGLRYFFEN